MAGYQKLMELYGPRGFAVAGFKFDDKADTEDPLLLAKKIGDRNSLATT